MSLNLPEGITEEELISTVDRIANQLCDKFKFGYYGRDDIKQECYILAIEALPRYDSNRPLINFLGSHLHNRLCNLKRDKYFRLEKPCHKCPVGAYLKDTDGCSAYDVKTDCKLYNVWLTKNSSKQNIMNPVGITIINDESERNTKDRDDVFSNVATKEIIDLIDENISLSCRKYWLQQKAGIKLSKKYYDILIEEIYKILEGNDVDVSETW